MTLNLELLRIAIALAGTIVLAVQDHKTSFMDDRILYAMIGAGALLTLASLDQTLISYTLAVAALIFIIGYAFYRKGQLGMGDVMLFVSLQMLLPIRPEALAGILNVQAAYPFSAIEPLLPSGSGLLTALNVVKHSLFSITVFMLASYFAALGSSLGFALKLRGRKLKPDKLLAGAATAASIAFLYVLTAVYGLPLLSPLTALFALLLLASTFFVSFKEQITRELLIRKIRIREIEDEDILALEEMDPKLVKKYGLQRVLTKNEVEKLKKLEKEKRVRLFPVLKGLPRFGPYILLALIATLLFGDLYVLMSMLLLQ